MAVHYLEIVSNDVDTLTGLYQRMHGLSFSPPGPGPGAGPGCDSRGGNSGGNPEAPGRA
jgi:hypothetical protein